MRSIATFAAVLLLSGCSAFAPKLESPRLSIANVELLSSNLLQQRLRIRIHVENPNDRTLPVSALTYSIEIDGQELARGAANESFIIPALGETEFATDVSANMAVALLTVLGRGHDAASQPVDYRIVGNITLGAGFVRSIPFEHKGTFKLQ